MYSNETSVLKSSQTTLDARPQEATYLDRLVDEKTRLEDRLHHINTLIKALTKDKQTATLLDAMQKIGYL